MSLMRIKSIEAEQFLQFRDPMAIEYLTSGLNVIAGDNEAGKSTLLQAIRAVLFDRHGSTVGRKYTPYNSVVSPKVKLVFEVDDIEYQLRKVFSSRREGQTDLQADNGQSWQGQAAEEHLSKILGFSYAKKGQSKSEIQGLAGLLWVEQSKAYEPVVLSDQSRQQIHGVFENEMRELLGGGQGEALHKRITELRSEYFDARDKPRSDYKKFLQRVSDVQQSLDEKRVELSEYEDKVDRLQKYQLELTAYQQEKVEEKAQKKLAEAKAVVVQVAKFQAEVEAGNDKLKRAEAEAEVDKNSWDRRNKLTKDNRKAEEKLNILLHAVEDKEAELAPLTKRVTELQGKYNKFKIQRDNIDISLRRARELDVFTQLEAEYSRLESALEKALHADSERRRCISEQNLIRVNDSDINRLREIQRTRDLTQERLNAIATRLEHRLETGAKIQLGEHALVGTGDIKLTETTELIIQGVGCISIIPGGEDLPALQRELEEQNHQLQTILTEVGGESVASAEQELRRSKTLQIEAEQFIAVIKGLASEGLSQLKDQYELIAVRRNKLMTSLGVTKPDDIAASEKQVEEIEFEAETLRGQITELEEHRVEEEQMVQQAREALSAVRANLSEAQRSNTNINVELEQARKEIKDEQLEKMLTEAESCVQQAERSLKSYRQALDEHNPEIAESELERAQLALKSISQNIQNLQVNIRDLKVELSALGQKGLAEEVATLESEYENTRIQLEQIDKRAQALNLLNKTLNSALQQAKETVAQPITNKLVPYLRQLIPDAAPLINEELLLTGIQRQGADEPFSKLSIGTREQLAVLVRLAYADLLAEEGVPVMLILDDALVNSDDDRRDRMKAILYQAAKRYQILILTCHGREYQDVGGNYVRLE